MTVKPAGMPSQPDASGDESLVDWIESYRRRMEGKPGRAFVGLVHRLDRPVGGLLVVAKTSKGARRLSESLRAGRFEKRYLAVCHDRRSKLDAGRDDSIDAERRFEWRGELLKSRSTNQSIHLDVDETGERIQTSIGKSRSAKPALTRWRILDAREGLALLELEPVTGRSHQLRVHAAEHGLPIVGDRKYGLDESRTGGGDRKRSFTRSRNRAFDSPALFAYRLSFDHPIYRERQLTFVAKPPIEWRRFGFDFERILNVVESSIRRRSSQ